MKWNMEQKKTYFLTVCFPTFYLLFNSLVFCWFWRLHYEGAEQGVSGDEELPEALHSPSTSKGITFITYECAHPVKRGTSPNCPSGFFLKPMLIPSTPEEDIYSALSMKSLAIVLSYPYGYHRFYVKGLVCQTYGFDTILVLWLYYKYVVLFVTKF